MPRPTDVVFRNFDELTYIASEDIIPRLPSTPTYPTKLLVNFVESNSDGSCEYWLLESGKTLRISTPSNQLMRSPPRTWKKHHPPHQSKKKTFSPINLLKSKSPSRSPPTTPPPISPCQSFCYPPLHPPYSSFSSRLKFWKRTKSEQMSEEAEEGSNAGMENQGSEFERMMWKAERDLSVSSRLWSLELFIDPDDISAITDNTTENKFCGNLASSRKRTISSSSSSTPKYCHSRSRSSSTLPPIMESVEPLEQCYHPQTVPSHDMTLEIAFNNKHEHTEQYSPEYIQCPMFNYQGNPNWDKSPFVEEVLVRYFSIPFCAPWVVVATIKLVFGWIPFFNRLVDFITSNGGATVLFLLSHLGLGLAALPLFILVPVVGGPVRLVHRLVVFIFRNMPWYGFNSLGCPGVLEDDEGKT